MIGLKRGARPSIFAYSFVLMLLALGIAEAIGVLLMISKPPLHNAPVSLRELAARLDTARPPRLQAGPPFGADLGPPRGLPPAPPNLLLGQLPGPPHPPGPGGNAPDPELAISIVPEPPQPPAHYDAQRSAQVRELLAALTGADVESIAAYIPAGGVRMLSREISSEDSLTEGFVVARKRADGHWQLVASRFDTFPTRFQTQAALLFVVGLVVLLPLAWLFARSLSAPIAEFSRAARRLSADLNVAPLSVEGPREMRAAVESFNGMQARLQGLIRERTQMIASIAHDLRTPLARLAFRVDDLPSPLREKMEGDLSEMKAMITGALEFIRERSANSVRERLDFRLLVESVVDDQSDLRRDVHLEPGGPVTVNGDSLALRRAITNVVENAVKYGQRARLRLTTHAGDCRLDIEDDGPGIDEAFHQQVFEPFFRLESSRTNNTSGIGLGLATVRALVLEHGGRVHLENRHPNGLRVRISLPLSV